MSHVATFVTSIMALAAGACVAQTPPDPERGGLAEIIERLSETSGYFDTDNLISNESSYLHVMGILDELDVRGGAYVGVGPDQNFSYMARIRPEVAFIIDVRRDNLLQHLLFKSLFEESVNRLEYLCLLYGRPVPADLPAWSDRDLEDLVQYVDSVDVLSNDAEETRARVRNRVDSFAIPLTDADRETIDRFHRTFIRAGLSLRFTTFGRPPRFFYPTHRDLLLAEDLAGRQASFLVLEEDYQFLRDLQLADRVIPVVGNLAGTHALPAIGRMVEDLGTTVSAIYSSNVEFGRLPFRCRSDWVQSRTAGGIGWDPADHGTSAHLAAFPSIST